MLFPQQLYQHIPHKVQEWTPRDVQKWFNLHKIQVSSQFSFVQSNFNGKSFISTTPQFIIQTCGVSSRIIMKKIIEWIQYDRQEFEEYVQQRQSQQKPQSISRPSQPSMRIETKEYFSERPSKYQEQYGKQKNKENTPIMRNSPQKHHEAIKPIEVQKWKKKVNRINTEQLVSLPKQQINKQSNSRFTNRLSNKSQHSIPIGANFVKSSYQILQNIIEFSFEQKSQFLNNSGKVGRNTCNDIIIVGESVSRKHAQIIKDKQNFYLKDLKSLFGTFVRIGTKYRKNIQEGDIIAFEDYQIQIVKCKYNKAKNVFDLKILYTQQKQIHNFYGKRSLIIGRDSVDISFDDSRIHANQARLSCQNGQLVITQVDGFCWKRLVPQQLMKIQQADESIRLGNTIVYTKLINSHKAIPSISEFQYFKP